MVTPGSWRALIVVLLDLSMEKLKGFLHFFHAVHAVFNADPSRISNPMEEFEDRVVVVESLSGDSVHEDFGISSATFGVFEFVKGCAWNQVAIACVHADYSINHFFEEFYRVIAGNHGIAWVVLHPKMRGARDPLEQFEEDVLFLSELGIEPKTVLVMVLKSQDYVVLDSCFDAFDDG